MSKHLIAYNGHDRIQGSLTEIAEQLHVSKSTVFQYYSKGKELDGWTIFEWYKDVYILIDRSDRHVIGKAYTVKELMKMMGYRAAVSLHRLMEDERYEIRIEKEYLR